MCVRAGVSERREKERSTTRERGCRERLQKEAERDKSRRREWEGGASTSKSRAGQGRARNRGREEVSGWTQLEGVGGLSSCPIASYS